MAADITKLWRLLFVDRSDRGLIQLFRYGFVGGLSAVVDIGTLFGLTHFAGVHYLASAAIAFILGTIVNYLLSVAWIFRSTGNLKAEFGLFTLIGLGGLGLNELIIFLLVEEAGFFYLWAKVSSVCVVLFWSFTLRRLLFSRLGRSQTSEATK